MAKSERQRQLAAEKKKRKAAQKVAHREEREHARSLEGQIAKISALSGQAGEIIELLVLEKTKAQVAEELSVSEDEVESVETAFLKLPDRFQALVVQYPSAFKNPRLAQAFRFAQKVARRGADGRAEISPEDQVRLHEMLTGQ